MLGQLLTSIKRLLLFCSGATVEILARKECIIEQNKYAGIGATILLTSVFACLSAAYALYTIFRSLSISLFLSLLWALFIFTLDRYIVSSSRKLPSNGMKSLFSELIHVLPRIILAIFIGTIIAVPLELRLFEPELQAQMSKNQMNASIFIERELDAAYPRIHELRQERENLEAAVSDKAKQCEQLRVESNSEAEGDAGAGRFGRGPIYKEKRQQYNDCNASLKKMEQSTQAKLDENNHELSLWQQDRDNRARLLKDRVEANGFLARLEALSYLAQQSSVVAIARILIIILFILLETAPILVSFFSQPGPYDYIYEAMDRETYRSQKEKQDVKKNMTVEVSEVAPTNRYEPNSNKPITQMNGIKLGHHDDQANSRSSIPDTQYYPSDTETLPFSISSFSKERGRSRDPYRLIGSLFADKYRLKEYAGGGGMGAVYRALQIDSNNWVALKILKPDIVVRNPRNAILFEREVKAAQTLDHPHIVRVLDTGITEDDIPFMVMEWLEGQTLEDTLTEGSLSIARIVSIFKQICEALIHAHGIGIIHLDIKPGNIFLLAEKKPSDYIKVIDFGMARVLSSETGTTVTRFLGTYQYCSPEHFGGKVSNRSDVYSLGATLYHMIAGVVPFGTSYINAKAHPNLILPPVPSILTMRPEIPAAIDKVLHKALSKNPGDRQQSVKQLLTEFLLVFD